MEAQAAQPQSDQAKNLQILMNALGEGGNGGRNFNEFLDTSSQGGNGVIRLNENLEMNGHFDSLDDMVSQNPITLNDIEQILGMSGGLNMAPRSHTSSGGSGHYTDVAPRSHTSSECTSFYATSPESGISGCHDRSPTNGVLGSPASVGYANGMDTNQMDNINNEIPNDLDMSALLDFSVENISGQTDLGLVMMTNNQISIPNNQVSIPFNHTNHTTVPLNQAPIPTNQVSITQDSILMLNGDPYLSQAMTPQFHPSHQDSIPNQPTISLSSQPSPQSMSLSSHPSPQSLYTLSFPPHTSPPMQHPSPQSQMQHHSPQSQQSPSLSPHPNPQYHLNQNASAKDALDDDITEIPFQHRQASLNQVPVHIKEEFPPENAVSVIRHSLAGAMSFTRPMETTSKSDPPIPSTVQILEKDVELKKEVDDGDNTCEVCRESAGKHSYYGGKVCPSCRAFFRRSVQSKYYEIFFCKKEEDCVVILKTRKNCQFCRFKKCLEAGMRTTWVLSDEERNRRFNKFNKLVPKTTKERSTKILNDRYLKSVQTRIPDLYMPFTIEEQKTMESIQETWKSCKTMWVTNLLHYNFEAGLDVLNVAFNGGRMKYTSWLSMAKSWEILFVQKMIYAVEEELRHLPQHEKAIFLNGENSDLAHNLKASACMLREERCTIDAQLIESARIQIAQQDTDLADRLGQLSLTGTPQYPRYESVFYDQWANNRSMEQKHLDLTHKIKQWPEVNQQIDMNMLLLVMMVVLFNPDSYEATVHTSCEKIQLRYTLMLQRYLQSKMPSTIANNKFVEGLLLISYSKEITDLAKMHVELTQY